MEKLEQILKNYFNKGSGRIDVTMVLSLIDQCKKDDNNQLLLHNVSNQRELLIAFFNHIHVEEIVKDVPMKIEPIIDEWLKSN